MHIRRLWRHWLAWRPRKSVLSPTQTAALMHGIQQMESQHGAEIRICLERRWPSVWALGPATSRDRAMYWFTHERVWDTAFNTGVLVYINLADRNVEIVADRGVHAHISAYAWQTAIDAMRAAFQQGDFFSGLQLGFAQLQTLLDTHMPPVAENPNELPDHTLIR